MIGYSIAVLFWNIIWLIDDIIKGKNFFRRYVIKKGDWMVILVWLYLLSGISALIFHYIK
jgi:hypothetical protein